MYTNKNKTYNGNRKKNYQTCKIMLNKQTKKNIDTISTDSE